MEQPALRTGIGIRFRVIFHILSAADVCPVFLMLFLLVVRWLDVQIYLRMMMEVVVGFLTLIAGIIDDPLHRICTNQFFHERNRGFRIGPISRNIGSNSIFADCGYIHIIARLQLPVAHVVFLHTHKSGLRVCFAVAASGSAYVDFVQIICDPADPFLNLFKHLLDC